MPRQRATGRRRRLRPWRGARARVLCAVAAIVGALSAIAPGYAQQEGDGIRNTYGEVGILDMPSARMAPDGELALTVGDVGSTQRYALAYQFLPWFEGSFRYSYVPGTTFGPQFHDRSLGMKIRLLKEDGYQPDISVGFRDMVGAEKEGSEYIAASKQIGALDLTAGLGWGRLADTGTLPNPFGYVLSSFKTRPAIIAVSTGGQFNFKSWFHGPRTGVFGGVVWHTPIDNLNLMAEFSSDKYNAESYDPTIGIKTRSPLNVGLSYRYGALTLAGGYFYGTTYGISVSIAGDTNKEVPSALRIGPPIPPAVVRDDQQQQGALIRLIDRNARSADLRAGGPWVHVPTEAERTKLDLTQALLSESRGVRNIDIQGATLVIDAGRSSDGQAQCARYAMIASANGARLTSVAMTDLQDNDGRVTFCPVATQAAYAQGDMQDAPQSARVTDDGGSSVDPTVLERKLAADLDQQALILNALSLGTSELWLYYGNSRYQTESEAAGRVVRVLMADAPPSVELFHLVPMVGGMPVQEITIARSALERAALAHGQAAGLGEAITLSAPPLDNPALDRAAANLFPRFYWALDPKLTEHIFDPDKPLQFMVYADVILGLGVAPGLTVQTELTGNIWNDYILTRGAGSVLPHVRTDLLEYIKHGAYGMSALEVVYRTRLARDVFGEAKAGYLEDMYMGAGGQLLWRPEGSRVSFGIDVYQVWKRDFDRLFGRQSYNILTGHASIYYESPWYGLNFNVHMGRYLAGDYGATFEVTRRSSAGVEIGFFATFTNVPFSKFGEGSFDKGIILHIPFEWGLPLHSQSSYDLVLHALTRDGGQRLDNDDSLYDETRRTSYGDIAQHFDDLVEP